QQRVDARRRDSELVAGRPQRRARASGAKVGDALGRRAESAATGIVEAALELLLELDARERTAARLYRHDQPGVRVGRRMARIAHAVRAQETWLGHGRHDLTAWAHAEAVHGRSLRGALLDQRVVRRSEAGRERGIGAVTPAIDDVLRVLDPNP